MQRDVIDWQAIKVVVDYAVAHGRLPDESKQALKKQLCGKDLTSVLIALTVSQRLRTFIITVYSKASCQAFTRQSIGHCVQALDSIAINCKTTRSYLASPKWMRRYMQNCVERPFTAPATLQLLVNWEHVYLSEQLGAAAHATRRQLAAQKLPMPKPNHSAMQMRELIEQQVPLIAFQHGMNFVEAFLPADAQPEPRHNASGMAERTSSGMEQIM